MKLDFHEVNLEAEENRQKSSIQLMAHRATSLGISFN